MLFEQSAHIPDCKRRYGSYDWTPNSSYPPATTKGCNVSITVLWHTITTRSQNLRSRRYYHSESGAKSAKVVSNRPNGASMMTRFPSRNRAHNGPATGFPRELRGRRDGDGRPRRRRVVFRARYNRLPPGYILTGQVSISASLAATSSISRWTAGTDAYADGTRP